MGILEPQPLLLRALALLFVVVGWYGVAQADGVPQVDLVLQHLGDSNYHSSRMAVWCPVQSGPRRAFGSSVHGGEDLLPLQLPGNLTGFPSGGTQLEDLPYYFCGLRVGNDLLGIVLCLLVAVAGPSSDPLPTLGLSFLHRPDLPAGVLA